MAEIAETLSEVLLPTARGAVRTAAYETYEEARAALAEYPADESAVKRHMQAAHDAERAKEDSWQRSDTDGFLSQWAHDLTAQREARAAELATRGGMDAFMVLVDVGTGMVVSTKQVTLSPRNAPWRQYRAWVVVRNGNRRYVTVYKRKGSYEVLGLRPMWVLLPAKAEIVGTGHGLSGSAWVTTSVDRERCRLLV